jgi:hypothetical protein
MIWYSMACSVCENMYGGDLRGSAVCLNNIESSAGSTDIYTKCTIFEVLVHRHPILYSYPMITHTLSSIR